MKNTRFPKSALKRYAELVLRQVYRDGGRERYIPLTDLEDMLASNVGASWSSAGRACSGRSTSHGASPRRWRRALNVGVRPSGSC